MEFLGFSQGGAGHTGKFFIHAEVVLDGDAGKGAAFLLYLYIFLGFYSLVQPLGVAASQHKPSGEFIHDDNLPILDDILLVFFEKLAGGECVLQVAYKADVFRVVEAGGLEYALAL